MGIRADLVGLVLVGVMAACGSGNPTLPGEGETAMPNFDEYSWSGCTAWSCESGQCPVHDPAVWGACCTEADPYGTPQSRPSCSGPAPYCVTYPARCSGAGLGPLTPPVYCYAADVAGACNYGNIPYDSGHANRCSPTHVEDNDWGDWPECFPSENIQ
jgi:hypothetical protein